ncbi:MAG: hypothetical protein ACK55I_01715, partial [bacterium]
AASRGRDVHGLLALVRQCRGHRRGHPGLTRDGGGDAAAVPCRSSPRGPRRHRQHALDRRHALRGAAWAHRGRCHGPLRAGHGKRAAGIKLPG